MRLNKDGVSLWYAEPDAPAPHGAVASGGDTSVMIGLKPADPNANVSVLHRINGGGPLTIPAHPHHNGTSGEQYFLAQLADVKEGDHVEYVVIYRSRGRQIPSNHEAESAVLSFTVEGAHGSDHHVADEHQHHHDGHLSGANDKHHEQAAHSRQAEHAYQEEANQQHVEHSHSREDDRSHRKDSDHVHHPQVKHGHEHDETKHGKHLGPQHAHHHSAVKAHARSKSAHHAGPKKAHPFKPEHSDLEAALREVLKAAKVPGGQAVEDAFVKLYFAHDGDTASFWEEVGKQSELKAHVAALQFALQLDLLTSGHVRLIDGVAQRPGARTMLGLAEIEEDEWRALIAKTGAPDHFPGTTRSARESLYLISIIGTLQAAFPTLTVIKIAERSPHVNKLAVTFLKNSKGFDIRTSKVDVYVREHSESAFNGIAGEDQAAVVAEAKRLQRLFCVSCNAKQFAALLDQKFTSAHAIAMVPQSTFVSRHKHVFGGEDETKELHSRAQFINARNIHLRLSIEEVAKTPPTRGMGHHSHEVMHKTYARHRVSSNGSSDQRAKGHRDAKVASLKDDLVKRFPNADQLFGTLALCNCDECESAIGPAAYFVDVLDFLGASKPNEHGFTPLDILIGDTGRGLPGRRPDLANMNLTCSNTNTAMPYIDIVNEVLENYVSLGFKLDADTAHDTADATTPELLANPQFLDQNAYKILDEAVYPFTLPFNRPLHVTRSYLEQLGCERYEVLKKLNNDQTATDVQRLLIAEYLKISPQQYSIITGHNIDPSVKSKPRLVAEYFGYSSTSSKQHSPQSKGSHWTAELANASTFLSRTGITYEELRSLIATWFISPNKPLGAAAELLQKIPVSYKSLSELLQSNLAHPADALLQIEMAGITALDLDLLNHDEFERVRKMLVLDDPQAACDPSTMTIVHFDGTLPSEHVLERIQRFIRLVRKVGWSIPDLDRALHSFNCAEIGPEFLAHVAQIKEIMNTFKVGHLQALLALWAPIETIGTDSLYQSLFLNKATHRQGFDPAFERIYQDSDVLTDPEEVLSTHLPTLRGALRVTGRELDLLLEDCGLDPETASLNVENVSAIFRRALLAKVLGVKIKDFLIYKSLCGVDPFKSPETTLAFSNEVRLIEKSGLSATQLDYLLRDIVSGSNEDTLAPQATTIALLASTIRNGLSSITASNAIAPDPNGTLTAQKLATLFDSTTASEIVGIVNGTVGFSAPLIALPLGIIFPPQVSAKIAFDPVEQQLTCVSPLTSSDRAALLGLSADLAYQAAIESIYQQPLDLIKSTFVQFTDVTAAQKQLVTEVASVDSSLSVILLDATGAVTTDLTKAQSTNVATKFTYVLAALLPYITKVQSAALIKSAIAGSLKVSDLLAHRLLDLYIKSHLDPKLPAIHDVHSLQQQGLSVSYYATSDMSDTPTIAIVPTVQVDGVKTQLPANVQGVAWSGLVAPTASGDVVFTVKTNGNPSLWVDDLATAVSLVQTPGSNVWTAEKVTLQAGQLYSIQLTVNQLPAQSATVTLLWQGSTIAQSVVPKARLYPSSIYSAFTQTYQLLHKAAIIVNSLGLSEDEVDYFERKQKSVPSLSINELPLSRNETSAVAIDSLAPHRSSAIFRAAKFTSFRNSIPSSTTSLASVFSSSTLEIALQRLVEATGWDSTLLNGLIGPHGFSLSVTDFEDERWILRLSECMNLVERLGVAPSYLFKWATSATDFDSLDLVGQEVKKCVHALYDADTWLTVAKPLNDKLRTEQRNSLVAYLVPRMELTDVNQLFEYFLIDPEMEVCTQTSRISLAHSSLQTFVQRCLMNLEENGDKTSVSAGQIDAVQWETWRKHYRFWQANYEVLLTPETWMQQGFRDDKTPFFTELESDLAQQEINADNVQTAYINYLEKLEEVARLEVIGTFWQDEDPDTGEQVNILHVFGRTFHNPHTYFYRTFVNFTTWTPWVEMQVTIDGDHLLPLIWNRKLYIFWPTFVKKAVPPSHPSSVSQSTTVPTQGAQSYWQVSLAWSVLQQNKWTGKQVSKSGFDIDPSCFVEDEPTRYAHYAYTFRSSVVRDKDPADSSLLIRCIFDGPTVTANKLGWLGSAFKFLETTEVVGAFEIGGCSAESVKAVFGKMSWPGPLAPPGLEVEALTFVQSPDETGLSLVKAGSQRPASYLRESPSHYRLLYPHQFSDYMLQSPLFYQDRHRSFFVSPVATGDAGQHIVDGSHVAFHRDNAGHTSRSKAAVEKIGKLPKGESKTRLLHTEADKDSEELAKLEVALADIGELFSTNASGHGTAWGHHAVLHHAKLPAGVRLKFELFYHPFVCEFTKVVSRLGVPGLLTQHYQTLTKDADSFEEQYEPTALVAKPYPVEAVDFGSGPYAIYNQELFFHIPDLVAEKLLQNQQYDDAIRWLKYIFNPTDDNKDEPAPERYWQYLPLKASSRDGIQNLIGLMESGDQKHSQLLADWANNPFMPYLIARQRPEAYKKNIFIKFVKTVLGHADALFVTDLKEAVNEALQLYIIAAHLLGPKPLSLNSFKKKQPESYVTLKDKLDSAGEMLALLENEFPFSGKVTSSPRGDSGGMQNLGRTLYFCTPKSDQFLALWDTVADRLYKIRNCLNFEGEYRQLGLFDPAIDPGMLVNAAALGMDLGSVLADISAPVSAYRFSYVLQRAFELCAECKSFGSALLAALEKNDAEALAVIRATHEVGIADLVLKTRARQLDEANAQVDALNASRNTAAQRYLFYQTLIGASSPALPAPGANIQMVQIPTQPSGDPGIISDILGGIQLNLEESLELTLSTAGGVLAAVAAGVQALATPLHAVPQMGVKVQPFGAGADVTEGGQQLGSAAESGSATIKMIGEILSVAGSLSGKIGSYARRQAEWTLQNNLAACEIMQIDRQIAAASVRADIAQKEYDTQQKQHENSQTVLDFMVNKKFTNQELYSWIVSQTSSSYFACYQLAYSYAKKAERTYQYELGITESNFIQFGYWDSMRKGLLAGDRLHLSLLQLEATYTDQNVRQYEISRDVSLLLNAPLALISLKETGICEVAIPESFFDADYPGHYMRRIKSMSLSIPCVVGAYTSLNCTMTLLSSSVRITSDTGEQYPENTHGGDDRFVNNFTSIQSIATSHGANDGGLFEVNFRDERYLPFEGAGAVSRWRIEIPKENNAFDFETISDIILHFKYTAKDGGQPLKLAARQNLVNVEQADLVRLFSLRHEFPGDWYKLLVPATATSDGLSSSFNLSQARFPYTYRGKTLAITKVQLFLKFKDIYDPATYTADGTPQGDYAGAKPLSLSMVPPGGSAADVRLKSDKSLYSGLPNGSADFSGQTAGVGSWTISVKVEDLAALPASLLVTQTTQSTPRIRSEIVSDLFMLVHYSAS